MPRPRKPLEELRRVGRRTGVDSGGRPLPTPLAMLRPAGAEPPEPPSDLREDGRELWERAWRAGRWLALDADASQVEETCRLADDLAVARRRYRVTGDPADARAVVALSRPLTAALSVLGFNPTARAALGVAEVRTRSALEELMARQKETK